jgi:hypothetical protein
MSMQFAASVNSLNFAYSQVKQAQQDGPVRLESPVIYSIRVGASTISV